MKLAPPDHHEILEARQRVISAAGDVVDARARERMRADKLNYRDAVRAVLHDDPDLAAKYSSGTVK